MQLSRKKSGYRCKSGLSCPKYKPLVEAMGFKYLSLEKIENKEIIEDFLNSEAPIVMEVFMDPQQLLVPKLSVSINSEGTLVSALEDLSPLVSIDMEKVCLNTFTSQLTLTSKE